MKSLALAMALVLAVPVAFAQKTKPKPKALPTKPTPQKSAQPTVGIKGAGQLAGGVLRFGDLFALKDGFTYQILSARYSLAPFEAYSKELPSAEEKLLILTVAIKNNRRGEDNFFGEHPVIAVDAQGQNYESGHYLLKSKPGEGFSPTLKPGQGVGQGATDPLELVIKVPMSARIVKLILKQGREGTQEEVTRFFMADATEAEAGGKPEPKNMIAPLPAWAAKDALLPPDQYVPSGSYEFKLTGFSKADKQGNEETPEGKRWVFAHITLKNPFHTKQNLFDFPAGDDIRELLLLDSDGEKYPAQAMLKAKRDEAYEGELDPGEERVFRIAFLVPQDATFKRVLLGSPSGHRYLFDASSATK